jgi:hypothetical protein
MTFVVRNQDRNETANQGKPVSVGGRPGTEMTSGAYCLGNSFAPDTAVEGINRPSLVYFRTESGKIYLITDEELRIDGMRRFRIIDADLNMSYVLSDKTRNTSLNIGEEFEYRVIDALTGRLQIGRTSAITEIVYCSTRMLSNAICVEPSTIESAFINMYTRTRTAGDVRISLKPTESDVSLDHSVARMHKMGWRPARPEELAWLDATSPEVAQLLETAWALTNVKDSDCTCAWKLNRDTWEILPIQGPADHLGVKEQDLVLKWPGNSYIALTRRYGVLDMDASGRPEHSMFSRYVVWVAEEDVLPNIKCHMHNKGNIMVPEKEPGLELYYLKPYMEKRGYHMADARAIGDITGPDVKTSVVFVSDDLLPPDMDWSEDVSNDAFLKDKKDAFEEFEAKFREITFKEEMAKLRAMFLGHLKRVEEALE